MQKKKVLCYNINVQKLIKTKKAKKNRALIGIESDLWEMKKNAKKAAARIMAETVEEVFRIELRMRGRKIFNENNERKR